MADATALPKDAQLIALMLKSFDISECEPQVLGQLLEFTYRMFLQLSNVRKFYFVISTS